MISFFRKIRNALMAQKKWQQYLAYALGEIILVVIGILLALQLDNWNDERIEQKALKSTFGYVLEDLAKDSLQLTQLKEQRQEAVDYCSGLILSYLKGQPFSVDTRKQRLGLVFYEQKFIRNLESFKKLEVSELFESPDFYSVREKIDAYKKEINRLVYDEERLNYFIEENERSMIEDTSLLGIYEYYRGIKGYPMTERLPNEINWLGLLKGSPAFRGILLRFEDDVYKLLLPQYSVVIEKGAALKQEIKKYLDNS
ncbi:DUF6090 family protein [Robiginitalea sp. IMCC43444]|uniref:DUF6090 family protein n=1 Tax=Robiginitalea sp. IMCC43444 TaxID=3459121 RepID=UPI0040421B0B